MTKVKICGITNSYDAVTAYKAGADFIGFVFYNQSPRFIAPDKLPGIRKFLEASGIKKWTAVGVFVNVDIDYIIQTVNNYSLFAAQLSGNETPEFCNKLRDKNIRVIKAIRVKDRTSLIDVDKFDVDSLLFDTHTANVFGGSGIIFNHDLIIPFAEKSRIFIAGGLDPENVGDIIKKVKPYAVDVSSGVEKVKGKKDDKKIFKFMEAVKAADALKTADEEI